MVRNRFAMAAITVTVSAATVIGLSASPAAASGDHSGRAYVHLDQLWTDEGDVSTSRHAYSNVACLWQKILWADGYLVNADIDGIFGNRTATATEQWKRDRNLRADGIAGINAWRVAGDELYVDPADGQLKYDGSARDPWITIDDNGRFGFYDDSVHRNAGYNYRTCT